MRDKKNWAFAILIGIIIILTITVFGGEQPAVTTPTITPTPIQQATPTPVVKGAQVISAQEAWSHVGEIKTVEYYVANPYQSSKGNVFLNEKRDYKTGFTTVIFANSAGRFGNPISLYGYKTIRTTGLIKMYQGHPEIIADDPSQVEIVK